MLLDAGQPIGGRRPTALSGGEAIDAATRRLLTLTEHALTLADKRMHPALRLRTAQSVLDYLLKLRELRNVEARLLALETAYANKIG